MLIPLTAAKRVAAFVTTKGALIGYTMLRLLENALYWSLATIQTRYLSGPAALLAKLQGTVQVKSREDLIKRPVLLRSHFACSHTHTHAKNFLRSHTL